jgi:hypothetical protein
VRGRGKHLDVGHRRDVIGTFDGPDRNDRARDLLIFLGRMGASLAALPLLPPILQDREYHQFADVRVLLGSPTSGTSSPIFPSSWSAPSDSRSGATSFHPLHFFGIMLTGFGSSYYHWSPNDDTLFWDRLPMVLVFMVIGG